MPAFELSVGIPDVVVTDVVTTPTVTVVALATAASTAACPNCGHASDRIHSRYARTVADLPVRGRPLILRIAVRRFRCRQPGCPRTVFCERLPGLLAAHARSTVRLADAHTTIGFALGGEAGARLSERLDMPTSPDTLLRRVKTAPDEAAPPYRYVGVDDWAIRKGQRYGTILIDLERGRVIDILPGRDGAALKVWLRAHPTVEVITRDRWAAYATAATEAAPQARQVADRWHLLKNLREAVERLFGRLAVEIRECLRGGSDGETTDRQDAPETTEVQAISSGESTCDAPAITIDTPRRGPVPSPRERERQRRRDQRAAQHRRVRELRAAGHSLRQIAHATGLSLKRVIRYARLAHCPNWNPGRRAPTAVDRFAGHVDAWIARGGRNAAAVYRELVALGCEAGYDAVRRFVARRLGRRGRPGPRIGPLPTPPTRSPPSARKRSFEFVRRPEERTAEERRHLERLRSSSVELQEGLDLAGEFVAQVRREASRPWPEWLAAAERSMCPELRSFAVGLRHDEAAVAAALTDIWSNGQVEGQVNRLKAIKRQMYGRAGFPLLRARVRRAA